MICGIGRTSRGRGHAPDIDRERAGRPAEARDTRGNGEAATTQTTIQESRHKGGRGGKKEKEKEKVKKKRQSNLVVAQYRNLLLIKEADSTIVSVFSTPPVNQCFSHREITKEEHKIQQTVTGNRC